MSKNEFKGIPIKVVPPASEPAEVEMEQVALYETHKKIYPRWVTGRFNNWRIFFVIATQLFFYGVAWLQWNDRQMLLFDLVNRKFFVFGFVFLPQDFIYLTSLLLISALGLFVWTSVGGRLWCGYACPQTVYTEIFLWMEKWIEGDRPARIKLDKAPMSAHKFRLKATKHLLWILFSIWTGFTFVGYFTPIRDLLAAVPTLSFGPWETFWVLFYGFATYGNAGWMREQVCKYMCPYARFQSAMFDADTLIISYDAERGDPRGSRRSGTDHKAEGLGDCIDCTICVQVCPVGIDIRDGLQYECIGCAACIDACDGVMDKVGYPRGLIRYTTEKALSHGYPEKDFVKHIARPRVIGYGLILLTVTSIMAASLYMRVPLKVNVMRDRNALVRETDEGLLENSYRLNIQNADEKQHRYVIRVGGLPDVKIEGDTRREIVVGPAEAEVASVRVQVEPQHATRGSKKIWFEVQAVDAPSISVKEKAAFIGR
ncbi:cytochrome c oxidase accessory protein CcoG [Parachitinimonas caeni]|uniref:Cytochrome c oxidase accessory protein CcoG n=1 Tax=Parachitinimonas caeni TaxID=3031301 RepID=A0ABT7DX53_9NEIS|nr:cytochrome c oxidase accessory protein CcoG [Parachitinimonas caeni]MDK2124654.1 cytochrome c oxidase accessory protein CcoG [Parachitinimonas caeni]